MKAKEEKQKKAEIDAQDDGRELLEYLEDDQIANVLRLLNERKEMRAGQMLRFYKWRNLTGGMEE